MTLKRILSTLATLVALSAWLLASPHPALAWPEEPPEWATVSGPGLKGEIKITDEETLAALKLGALEDFDRGALAAPPNVSGPGYQITRYFYKGTFNFAQLTYYPDPAGGTGYLYWQDGPDLDGDPTPYNGQWLYATPAGEAALKHLLATGAPQQPPSAPAPAQSLSAGPSPSVLIGLLGVIASALAASIVLLRRRPAPVKS
jgi:hypothetical protein